MGTTGFRIEYWKREQKKGESHSTLRLVKYQHSSSAIDIGTYAKNKMKEMDARDQIIIKKGKLVINFEEK